MISLGDGKASHVAWQSFMESWEDGEIFFIKKCELSVKKLIIFFFNFRSSETFESVPVIGQKA